MKRVMLMPALLALGAATPLLAQDQEQGTTQAPQEQGTAQAPQEQGMTQAPQENVTEVFDQADADGNGILSIEEAREALPELSIEDRNGDGWLNHAEIDAAVPELELSIEDAGGYSVVGESDYLEIRQQIDDPAGAAG